MEFIDLIAIVLGSHIETAVPQDCALRSPKKSDILYWLYYWRTVSKCEYEWERRGMEGKG